jgi:outer membrane lipoprotein-sorting protein
MKISLILRIVVFLFILFPAGLLAEKGEDIDVDKILDELDRTYRADDSYAEISMTIINPNWKRTVKMKAWSKDMDRTFIRILSPKKDRGISTLRVDKEMWNYFPKINKVMKIPPSMMMGSWMGSDFTNDDLVKESTYRKDYSAQLIRPEKAEEGYYYLELKPKETAVSVWDKIIVKARKEDYLPVRADYFDGDGNKVREMNYRDFEMMGGKKLPAVMEVIPTTKEGHKTVIEYRNAEFNEGVPDSVFSLRNLKKKI